ncbi:ATP-dependent exonuclase V beta subunit, helicase and exonuclease domain-containing [Halobacteroides halobius DSM 5150]|uniref:DNA 3'-5' helicase n=1 Tax=Halobacteroides halobius (strain ATCC 35273 / DSM 5150 / MD-1) TaxID=748449 RepID=L0K9K2_HALHC|nr:UvrD-helicase domain-containing protein [Halobacteroides halobius]AGB41044.1 ATP-dependent exonuclase V beta subunit, helicase and exonuclease domain-containing [Halobacteroides halobius DSM 5150]
MINILKASAGTGKTYRLSLEYVAALLNGEDFEEIVVMTFTRKATAEIRERIFEHLADILDQGSASQVFQNLQEVYDSIELDLNQLETVYRKMLHNKDEIKIYTIDSFINSIFKQAIAPYLDIYSYQIVDGEQNKEVIERVFKGLLDNPSDFRLMEQFLLDNVERDIDNYLTLIQRLLKNRWKLLLLEEEERSQRKIGNLVAEFESAVDTLKAIAVEKGNDFSEKYFKKDFRQYLDQEGLTSKKDYIIKNYKQFFKDKFWNGNKTRGKKVASLRQDLEVRYDNFRQQLANYFYNQELIPYERELFKLSQRVFKIYDRVKFKEKLFTHADISNYTYQYLYSEELNLLEGESVSDYFFELLGSEVNNLLIDEFQDTSILQWRILQPLVAECENVIAVGDEKQSIYGWRGGEKELFANLEEILNGDSESLQTSYRSHKEIIDFVNRFFEGIYGNWDYQGVNHLSNKDGGYVEVLYGNQEAKINTDTKAFSKLSEEEQEQLHQLNQTITADLKAEIAETIKENFNNYNELGILARSNNELAEIADQLDKEGIPYILESKDSLIEHQAVKPLYFLLTYLTYNDYLALIKFLRSELVGVNNGLLKYLLQNKSKVIEYLAGRDVELRDTVLTEVLATIRDLKELDFNSLTNYLVEDLGLLQLYQDNASALKNIYYFFAELKKFESLAKFMAYIEENKDSTELKQVGVQNANAVQLMTIHKAKGLSFETEFFYWNPKSYSSRGDNLKIYLDFDEQFEQVEDYLLTNSRYSHLFEYLDLDFQEQEEEKAFVEEINNVYVALTRPVRNLFLYIKAPCRYQRTWATKEWQGKDYEIYEDAILRGTGQELLKDLAQKKTFGELIVNDQGQDQRHIELPNLQEYFQVEEVKELDNSQDLQLNIDKEVKRIKGLAVHYYLEYIKYATVEEREYAQSMVLAKYGNILGPERIKEVITRVERLISSHQDYFSQRWDVYTEYQLMAGDESYRIDRLLVDQQKQEVMIVDYKTGSTQEQEQLDNYAAIVESKLTADYEVSAEFLEV